MSIVHSGMVVTIHYVLSDPEGHRLESSRDGEPLTYLHGYGGLVAGMERALEGRAAGDVFQVVVPPEEGYGPRQPGKRHRVPRSALPPSYQPSPGAQLWVPGEDGNQDTPMWIVQVTPMEIVLDENHPMAGRTLHFEVEVVALRPATADELSHGHAHGHDGHHHHH